MKKILLVLPLLLWACSGGSEEPKLPTVQNINLTTQEDTPKTFVFLGTDPENQPLSYSINTPPQNGSVVINGGAGTYIPNDNYYGDDTFLYVAATSKGNSNIGTVLISITPSNDNPNSNNMNIMLDEDIVTDIQLDIDEYDGDQISVSIIDQPQNGNIVLSGSIATYTPNENYFGSDSFTYEAVDSNEKRIQNVATVTLTINPINDPPEVKTINSFAFVNVAREIFPNLRDPDGDNVSLSISTQPNYGNASIATYNNSSNQFIIYEATSGVNLEDELTIIADDGYASSESTINFDLFKTGNIINNSNGMFFDSYLESKQKIDGKLQTIIPSVSNSDREIGLLSTDLLDHQSSSQSFDFSLDFWPYDWIGNAYLVPNNGGAYRIGYFKMDSSNNSTDGYIYYFDNNGDKVWERYFNSEGIYSDLSNYNPNNEGLNRINYAIIADDNSIIASVGDFGIVKVNQSGDLVWQTNETYIFDAVVQHSDGNYIFVDGSYIIKIDSSGNVISRNNDEDFYLSGWGADVIELSNGNIAILTEQHLSDNNGTGYDQPAIIIFDSNLNFITKKTLHPIEESVNEGYVNLGRNGSIAQSIDGGLIIAGNYDIKNNNTERAFIVKLNANLDYEWVSTFGADPYGGFEGGMHFLYPFYVTELDNQNIRIGCWVYAASSDKNIFYFDLDNNGNRILSN
tara:strand:- start:260 stop:2311 length:2052 start_codon:yes stop_codon:yes gene_type:complete